MPGDLTGRWLEKQAGEFQVARQAQVATWFASFLDKTHVGY